MVSLMKLVLPASRNPVNKYTGTSIFCSELKSENLLYLIIINAGTNYAKTADNARCTGSYIRLSRNVIEVNPLAVLSLDYTLCAKDHTV